VYLKISWTKVRKSFGLPKVYRAGTIIKNFYYHLQRFGKRPTGAPEIGSSESGGNHCGWQRSRIGIGIGIGIDCTRRRCAPTKKGFPKEGNPFYRRIPGYILSSSR
jgi:hypothetical protein